MPGIHYINTNDEKFVSLMNYIVLDDLKVYGQYMEGLLLPVPEEEEASMFNENAQKRQNLKKTLQDLAGELENQFDKDKQKREIDKFKEYKLKLSPLSSSKSIPLYNDDKNEYWQYLTGNIGNEDHKDGLLFFIIDIFENIEKNVHMEMSKPFQAIIAKIRHVL